MAERPSNWRQLTLTEKAEWHKQQTLKDFDAVQARANKNVNDESNNKNDMPVREKPKLTHATIHGSDNTVDLLQSNGRFHRDIHSNDRPDNDRHEDISPTTANADEDAKIAKQAHPKAKNPLSTNGEDEQSSPEIPLAKLASRRIQHGAKDDDNAEFLHNFSRIVASTIKTNKGPAASSKGLSIWSDRRPSGRVATMEPMSLKRKVSEEKPELNSKPLKRNSPPTGEVTVSQALERKLPFALPDWYRHVDVTHSRTNRNSEVAHLVHVRDALVRYQKTSVVEDKSRYLDDIRKCIHEYEHTKVDEIVVKKSKLLEPQYALPQLFTSNEFPPDIRGDAKALYLKWCRRDFDPDLLRGINESKKVGRLVSSFDKDYSTRLSAAFFGTGDIENGQWWPNRLCALRDGAHGSSESGIYGPPGEKGAASIVLSGSHYEDEDKGDVILYCGTEGSEGQKTEFTRRMIDSIGTRNPVRVLRTDKLDQKNVWRPVKGIRYDGLYTVINCELLDQAKAHYRFRLERVPGQDPIRNSGIGSRPTTQDVDAFEKHRERLGKLT